MAALLIIAVSTFPGSVCATKPCPPSPCVDRSNAFIGEECGKISDWVAVGRIIKVKRGKVEPPTNKDFAYFELKVTRWEKGAPKPAPARIRFRVGWCVNQSELPRDTKGEFRFWGTFLPDPTYEGGWQYHHFERIE